MRPIADGDEHVITHRPAGPVLLLAVMEKLMFIVFNFHLGARRFDFDWQGSTCGPIARYRQVSGAHGIHPRAIEVVVDDPDVLMDGFLRAGGINGRIDADTAPDERVAADKHIAHRRGFKPFRGIGRHRKGSYGAAEENVVFNDGLAWRGQEHAAHGIHADMIVADGDIGMPGYVIDNIILSELGDFPVKGQYPILIGFPFDGGHLSPRVARVFPYLRVADHGGLIPRHKSGETIGLGMHESNQQAIVANFLDDAQVGTMAVDGIILHAGEAAGVHQDIALAVGKLEDVGPCGAGADRVAGRRDIHPLKGDVLGELANEAHPGKGIEITIPEDDVFAARGVNADRIAFSISEMILMTRLEPAFAVRIVQADLASAEIPRARIRLALRFPAAGSAGTMAAAFFQIERLAESAGSPVAPPVERPAFNRIVGALGNLNHCMRGSGFKHPELGDSGSLEVEHQSGEGDILRMVIAYLHHPAVIEYGSFPVPIHAAALKTEMLEPLNQDADRLGGV